MHQSDLPTSVLRFPAVLGPKQYRRFQRWLQPMLRADMELRIQEGWARWRWTHGFAEDVAEAVVLGATKTSSAGRIYNVGECYTPTMADRLWDFARVADWRGRIIEVRKMAYLGNALRQLRDERSQAAVAGGKARLSNLCTERTSRGTGRHRRHLTKGIGRCCCTEQGLIPS